MTPVPLADPLLTRRLVGFVRLLRDNGFMLGLREAEDALRAAAAAGLARPEPLRQALRALLCSCERDWRRFDELFDAWWLRRGMRRAVLGAGRAPKAAARPSASPIAARFGAPERVEHDGEVAGAAAEGRAGGASAAESLAATDLRHIADPDELERLHALAERLAARMRHRLSRREKARRRGRRLDFRRVIHKSVQSGGTPIRLVFRRRRDKPVRLVAILDVSGSMSPYATFFVRFLKSILDRFREADAFVFHTRLVHIGPALGERNTERAILRLSLLAEGWSGGTRIGESLAAFNRRYAASVLNRRAIVVVVSDGYDTGPPEQLAEEMAALRRRARRIIWLNPMLGWQGYEPVARGMAAALPHVDLFAPAHNLKSLAALEPYLAAL
ncbi:MAG: vWA domain-containing protein [Geminicoccaceae bacterium]